MKCLLIDANWQRREIGPRLALGCLAGAISDLVDVEGTEFLLCGEDIAETRRTPSSFWLHEQRFLRSIMEKLQADPEIRLVGVTGWSGAFPRMLRIARCCKKVATNEVKVVFGGPHVTLHERFCPPDQSILRKYDCVDYLVLGEGESPFRELAGSLTACSSSAPFARGVLHSSCLPSSETRCSANCMGASRPFWAPFLAGPDKPTRLVFLVESGRGCPHRCRFCDEHDIWQKYRWFSPSYVVDNIERGLSDFGSHSLRFADSTLTANPGLEPLCREIVNRRLRVAWSSFAHCGEVTEWKAALMAEAGCKCVLLGVESGVQSVLDAMDKNTSRGKIESAVGAFRKQGIVVRGSFILGYPGETPEKAMATIDFARSLHLDAYAWHVYQPPFRCLWQDAGASPPDFEHYELDCPPEVALQVLAQEPALLRDMHALPRLLVLDASIQPDPQRWPFQSVQLLSILRKAMAETPEGSAHDLEILVAEERARREPVAVGNTVEQCSQAGHTAP